MTNRRVKFLLVDDLEENLLALEGLLRREGLQLLKARSGKEALELLLVHDVALALLDVQMPEMDGFTLAELMRGTERTRAVPIIFVTAGMKDYERRFRGYELGAVDFLYKPIDPHILKSKADVFFALARQRDELRASAEEKARLLAERIESERRLAESELRFREAFAHAPVGMALTDLEGHLLYVNRAYCQLTGYEEDELMRPGMSFQQITHPDDLDHNLDVYKRLIAGEIPAFFVEKRYVRKDGTHVWVRASASLRRDAQGRQTQIIGLVEDITERKRAEAALRDSEERFRALAENIPQLAWMTDERGGMVWFNKRWYDYTGTTLEQMRGSGWQALHHPDHTDRVTAGWQSSLKTGEPWEDTFPLRGKHGQYCWFLSRAFPIRDSSGKVARWFGTNTEITEQREAEERLRTQFAVARILNDASSLVEATPKLLKTIGESMNWHLGALWKVTGADELHCVELWHSAAIDPCEFMSYSRQHSFIRGVGLAGQIWEHAEPLWIPDITLKVNWQFPRASLAAKEGLRAAFGFPIRVRDHIVGVLEFFGTEVRQPNPDVIKMLEAVGAQIGQFIERTRAEEQLRKAQAQLQQHAEHLEKTVDERTAKLREAVSELEHFSYTITHDMRGPLRAMQSFGQILTEECGHCLEDTARDYLRRITQAASRMDRLITDALNYSKAVQTELTLEPIDPGPLLRGIVESYPQFQPPHAEIELAAEFPRVCANEAGLTQCFSNLLGNAVKFVEAGTNGGSLGFHVPGRQNQVRSRRNWTGTARGTSR